MLGLSSSSSSDSSDGEVVIECLNDNEPIIKNEHYVEETVPSYSDQTFQQHFRLTRPVVEELVEEYRQSEFYYENADGKYGSLGADHQLLTFLWYMAHQTASFRDVADRFDCSISTLFHIIKKLTTFFSNMARNAIKWPTNEEKREIETYFSERGFPGVTGVIDGCHIKIDKPQEDSDSYINRKQFYSIQMQVVCDNRKIIRDVFIGYPGSVHDSRVFRVSPLSRSLAEKCGESYYLLGDSGYPCTRYVMTPFRDRGNLTPLQRNYNLRHTRNRYVIEHCFGMLKQRCRQLYLLKLRKIDTICHFIRACCVIHNIAINNGIEILEEEGGQDEENQNRGDIHVDNEDVAVDDGDGIARRNYIAEVLYN